MSGIFGNIAGVLAIALFLATVNKALLDLIAAPVRRRWPAVDLWWFDYLSLATGALLAWIFDVNLLAALAPTGSEPARIAGIIISGLVIGGGADLLNDLFAGVQGRAAKSAPPGVMADLEPGAFNARRVAGW